jgi:hypothetical protein
MCNTDPTKISGGELRCTFLLLIRHLPCYSYIQSGKILGSDRGVKEVILRMEIRENPEEMGWKQ